MLKQFGGIITPDCSLALGQSACLQQTNTYFHCAVGFYLQENGIAVIPNVRFNDARTYEFCFDGIEKDKTVAVGTHGCINRNDDGVLPQKNNRIWYEADINYTGGYRNTQRIVFSNDGLVFVTYDHYKTFIEITGGDK